MLEFLLGFIPGLIWLGYFLKKDAHPEPKKIILKTFILGGLAAFPAILLEAGLTQIIPFSSWLYFFVVIAPVEEILKYSAARFAALKSRFCDEKIDIMVYLITAGLGFATIENILLILKSSDSALDIIVIRFLSATLLHALLGSLLGYFFAKKKTLIEGLGIAILGLGSYNFF